MKQRAHIEQCKLQYIELQLTQKCVTLKNRAARRTGGQQKPADKPRGCLSFGRNSKCIMIAVNSKWLIATHILHISAVRPKGKYFGVVIQYRHGPPHTDPQWSVWTHPSAFIGICDTWSNWDHGFSCERLEHEPCATQHVRKC